MNNTGKTRTWAIAATIAAIIFLAAFLVVLITGNRSQRNASDSEENLQPTEQVIWDTTALNEEIKEEATQEEETPSTEIPANTEPESDHDETETSVSYQEITDQINAGNIADGEMNEIPEDTGPYVIIAWENMLAKMHVDADIVFFGDSITKQSDFQKYFPDRLVLNLGLGGETIKGSLLRASMIKTVTPEKIFIMTGVNSLRDYNFEECKKDYETFLDMVIADNPSTDIYVQSVLPTADWFHNSLPCSIETTLSFNAAIKDMAEIRGIPYIDLYSLYEKDGQIDPLLASDGVHPDVEHGFDIWAETIEPYIYD